MKIKSNISSGWASRNNDLLMSWGLFFGIFICIWGFIAISRIGITPDVAYWNEAGVPILSSQIIFSLFTSILLFEILPIIFGSKLRQNKRIRIFDLLLPLVIWLTAAGVWISEPQVQSFNAPRPSPPAYEYYPFSDATSYDIGGQFVLVGQGINNNLLTDKPVYMVFLALLHALGGQSLRVVINLQVIILALFPVMLYLLGSELKNRGAGILIALLGIFKERNAVSAALYIQVSHVKLMMTEVPTALLLSLAALLMIRWAKKAGTSDWSLPVSLGCILGAAVLLRANSFLILPVALLIPFLFGKKNLRKSLVSAGFVVISFLAVTLPWLITNRDQDGRSSLELKLNNVLERYEESSPSGSGSIPTIKGEGRLMLLAPDQFPTTLGDDSRGSFPEDSSTLMVISSHFIHNQIASLLELPMTVRFQNLAETLTSSLWDKSWAGSLSLENRIMLFINLGLLTLGLSSTWKRWKFIGLLPLMIEVLYFLANALARTSGSRYLVPADWVVYFYYSIGLYELARWLILLVTSPGQFHPYENQDTLNKLSFVSWLMPVLSFLLLGLFMPFSSLIIPQRYPEMKKGEAYWTLRSSLAPMDLGYSSEEIKAFLRSPESVVIRGRLLYPRYFLANEGLCTRCFVLDAASMDRSFPRLTFVVIGPMSAGVVVEMDELPQNFRKFDLSKAPDVWVMGCKNPDDVISRFKDFYSTIRGLVIIVSSKNEVQIYSPPGVELICNNLEE